MNNRSKATRHRRRLGLRLRRRQYHRHDAKPLGRRRRAAATGHGNGVTPPLGAEFDAQALLERQREQALRLQAEFENFRRRARKEMAEVRGNAGAKLIQSLLPVLDNLERALDQPSNSIEGFVEGVKMIQNQFLDVLREAGLEPIEAVGQPFDPHVHEAVMVDPSDEHPDNHILEVLQAGYRVRDKLVRPAMVKVSRKN